MPIFEFTCKKCGHTLEVIEKTEPSTTECPNCKRAMKRKLSSVSFKVVGGTPKNLARLLHQPEVQELNSIVDEYDSKKAKYSQPVSETLM